MNVDPGIYKGIVTNNTDPEGLNRLKAIVPQVLGNATTETDWALPVVMPGWSSMSALVKPHRVLSYYTGGGVATLASPDLDMNHVLDFPSPNPGHGVWIAFEGGDIEYPMWLGVWK